MPGRYLGNPEMSVYLDQDVQQLERDRHNEGSLKMKRGGYQHSKFLVAIVTLLVSLTQTMQVRGFMFTDPHY